MRRTAPKPLPADGLDLYRAASEAQQQRWLHGAHEVAANVVQTLPSSVQYAPAKTGGMTYTGATLGLPAHAR